MHVEINPSESGELPPAVVGAVLVDERDVEACYTEQPGALPLVGRTLHEVLAHAAASHPLSMRP